MGSYTLFVERREKQIIKVFLCHGLTANCCSSKLVCAAAAHSSSSEEMLELYKELAGAAASGGDGGCYNQLSRPAMPKVFERLFTQRLLKIMLTYFPLGNVEVFLLFLLLSFCLIREWRFKTNFN